MSMLELFFLQNTVVPKIVIGTFEVKYQRKMLQTCSQSDSTRGVCNLYYLLAEHFQHRVIISNTQLLEYLVCSFF